MPPRLQLNILRPASPQRSSWDGDNQDQNNLLAPSIEVLPTGTLKLYKSMQAFEFNPRGMIAAATAVAPKQTHSYKARAACSGISECDVRMLRQLGAGACGVVHKAWLPREARFVAVKKISVLDRGSRHQLMNDIKALCNAPPCDGLVQFHGAYHAADRGQIAVVLEYVDGGSLADVIAKVGAVPERILAPITARVLRALGALHGRRLLHRDIKPANVLLTRAGDPRVADFGISATIPDATLAACHTFTGTVTYMSPERVDGLPYGLPSDVWALGLTLLEAVTGKYPYDASAGVMQLMVQVMEEECPLPAPGAVSPACRSFLAACLARDPTKRASIEELLRHPWVAGSGAQGGVLQRTAMAATLRQFMRCTHDVEEARGDAVLAACARFFRALATSGRAGEAGEGAAAGADLREWRGWRRWEEGQGKAVRVGATEHSGRYTAAKTVEQAMRRGAPADVGLWVESVDWKSITEDVVAVTAHLSIHRQGENQGPPLAARAKLHMQLAGAEEPGPGSATVLLLDLGGLLGVWS
ncbi:Mitogen-activated protein kinase kinase 2 [Auxenochlorella protothecoides]|uniref:mitogen-activated protein kinase kinase n=1 Tax=Auxenochlorella protothecoides TaxID=3075 RepID=A0A087SF96_AUXPR|nr:Mitogen-activated protein kinase kinase 2 [Auxenochlorella protothecoides]KFM24400.1 Mitogen-activated protein kinase kinase 2 [Auxenochlorella protothecoides]